MSGWIGVDLDGTLAKADDGNKRHGFGFIGEPVPAMLARVHDWLSRGIEVRILTARVSPVNPSDMVEEARTAIEAWCLTHLCRTLPVTCEKDYAMVELWDDRCVQVMANTGETAASFYRRQGVRDAYNTVIGVLTDDSLATDSDKLHALMEAVGRP